MPLAAAPQWRAPRGWGFWAIKASRSQSFLDPSTGHGHMDHTPPRPSPARKLLATQATDVGSRKDLPGGRVVSNPLAYARVSPRSGQTAPAVGPLSPSSAAGETAGRSPRQTTRQPARRPRTAKTEGILKRGRGRNWTGRRSDRESRGSGSLFPWDMKEITAGLRKTQWRRKVRIRGGRGPAGRRESGAGGGGAGIQDPGGAVLSVPARSQGGRSRGPDSERGKDGEAGPRRGAPGEGQGNARVREGGPSEFPDAPCPAQPSPGPDGEQSVAIASPAQPLGQRARVRSGPRTSHPVPGRHPTQGPGVGWRPSGPALPPPRGPGAARCRAGRWRLQGARPGGRRLRIGAAPRSKDRVDAK